MVEDLRPKQGAFFPGEDGSITVGQVDVLPNGTPNVGGVRRRQELREEWRSGITRFPHSRWKCITNYLGNTIL